MNIVQINTLDTRGGAANIAYRLKNELAERGHETSLFVKSKDSTDPNVFLTRKPGLISKITKSLIGKDVGSILANVIRPYLANDIEWFNTKGLRQSYELKNADIVHCHNLHGNYFNISSLSFLSKNPIVWTLHDMWAITPHCAHTKIEDIVNGFYVCESMRSYQDIRWHNEAHLRKQKETAYKSAKIHIVSPCKWLDEKVAKSVLAKHPHSVIYNGVDTDIFKPKERSEARESLGIPENARVILTISAIGGSLEKGWNIVEKMADHLAEEANVYFLTVGATINRKIGKKNIISIPYVKNPAELARFYNTADILLFPSPRETLPLTIIEALACGIPTVATNTGGVSEIIQNDKTGWLVPSGSDYLVYAHKIRDYIKLTESDKKRIADTCRTSALEKFSLKGMLDAYESLYKTLAKKNV